MWIEWNIATKFLREGKAQSTLILVGIAVGVAAQTPDNPLQGVTTQTSGLVRPGEEASGGALVLPGGLPVGGSATSPAPISNPAGN